MVDATNTAAIAALVVAFVALVVAAGQLTQQLLATAYVIRKCDRIVTGGLTKGGTRQWHWRQFRYTVKYQAISFALPKQLYASLGVSPAIQVVKSDSQKLLDRAIQLRPKRTFAQASWVSFTQDLAKCTCIGPEDVSLSEESGDRIPEDLTVAPIRVDAISVLLTCVAMGMQVYKYSPTTGEIILSGGVGSISSSSHPLLGTLLHYSVFANESARWAEEARRHASALHESSGVWANAIFGKFQDLSYRREFTCLRTLIAWNETALKTNGWPEGSQNDTIGGAACFMAFGNVCCLEMVPPSTVRPWCAHFAEVIVCAHLVELAVNDTKIVSFPPEFCRSRDQLVKTNGYSSPHCQWELFEEPIGPDSEKRNVEKEIRAHLETGDTLASWRPTVAANPQDEESRGSTFKKGDLDTFVSCYSDPSSYLPMTAAWECIMRADQCRHILAADGPFDGFRDTIDEIIVKAISPLAETGAVSWGDADSLVESWPQDFAAVCEKVLDADAERAVRLGRKRVIDYARLSILRAAYYTIMMRAAGDVGPGITEDSRIDTALVFMA